jgi:hypothetical protein
LLVKTYPAWAGLLLALLLLCGCATVGVDSLALHRPDDVKAVPRDALVGLTEFTVCGGSYLERLSREQQGRDPKADFFRTCTELGHPQTFTHRLRQRLEERLGSKLVPLRTVKSFKPRQVLQGADKLALDYVIAGDLLYLGEADNRTVVSALFYLIRVADGKTMVVGRVMKEGALGKLLQVIDEVADELYDTAYKE